MDCLVCGSKKWTKKYKDLVECKDCKYIRANNKYFKFNPQKLYTTSYFKNSDYADYEREKGALEKNFSDRIERIRRYKKGGSLLEVGSAFGFFLNLAKKYFKITGVDLDKNVTKQAARNSGAKVFTGDLPSLGIKKSSYDIICMFDVIEHLKEPAKHIEKIHKILKDDGVLIIETGDIGSYLAMIQKDSWRLIKPPFHLQYFSKKTITIFLEKLGFEIVKIEYVPFYRTLLQTIYSLTHKDSAFNLPFIDISFPINTYDLMFVIAKKKKI